jgi:MFS family permease
MSRVDERVLGTGPAHPTFRGALRAREFRWLMITYAVLAIGQTFGTVAVTVAVFDQTGSATWVAIAAAARLVPYVALSGLAGVLADRVPRKPLLALSAGLRAVLAGVLAIAVGVSAPPAVIVALAFCFTACGTPVYPSLAAAIPTVVPAHDLAPANGVLTGLESVAFVAGPAAGAAALVLGSPEAALAANALIFGLGLVTVAHLRQRGELDPASAADELVDGHALTAGIRALASGGVAAPLLLVVVVNLVYGGSLVGLVIVAEDLLGTGESGFATLNAAVGIGAFAGVLLTNRLARAHRAVAVLGFTTLLTGIPLSLLAVVHVPEAAALLMVASGMGSVLTEVLAVTLLQRATPRGVIARVFGILDSLIVCAILVGTLVAPVLIHALGLRESLILVGAVVPITAVCAAAWLQATADRVARVTASLEPWVTLLRRLTRFERAPRPALQALAATATLETAAAGTRIIDEGAMPDDYFVLVSGTVEVRRRNRSGIGDEVVATLADGAGFGELGLLQAVPRTASVVATERSTLLRISGARFIATVNAVPQSAGVAPGGGLVVRLGAGASEEVGQ